MHHLRRGFCIAGLAFVLVSAGAAAAEDGVGAEAAVRDMTEAAGDMATAAAAAVDEAVAESKINMLDTCWVLLAGFLVFFMNAGFAFLEAGFCRAKNTVNILAKNYFVFALATIAFWLVGYMFMFGDGKYIGVDGSLALYDGEAGAGAPDNLVPAVFFFFQVAFAAAGCSIVSGAVAERIKFHAYIIFGVVFVAFIYSVEGHWVWGDGWLADMGFHDFAGSGVVHATGGFAALAGIMLLGPRRGKFAKDGSVRPIPGHSIALATLGGFILWLGWFGFNPGSELAMDSAVPRVALTTNLAACAGIITSCIFSWIKFGKPDFAMIVNGCLAGLVAVTAPCAVVTPLGAILIGAVAGVLVVPAVLGFDALRLDDPVGATAVHLVNGVWGVLAVGLFASPAYRGDDPCGLFYGGGFELLGVQALGMLAIGVFVFAGSLVIWGVLRVAFGGIRVSEEEELEGLDYGEMGTEAYPRDAVPGASAL